MVIPKTEVQTSVLGGGTHSSPKRESYYCDTATEAERQARIERRRKIFEEIEQGPSFDLPEEYSDIAQMIRDMREERDEQIFAALGGMK